LVGKGEIIVIPKILGCIFRQLKERLSPSDIIPLDKNNQIGVSVDVIRNDSQGLVSRSVIPYQELHVNALL